jgi:hypothetical protein
MTLNMKEELSNWRYTQIMRTADMNTSPSNNFDKTEINYMNADLITKDNKMLNYCYKKQTLSSDILSTC